MPFSFPAGSGTSKRSHTFRYASAAECGCCCAGRGFYPFGHHPALPWYRHHAHFLFAGEVEDYDTLGIQSETFSRVTGAASLGTSRISVSSTSVTNYLGPNVPGVTFGELYFPLNPQSWFSLFPPQNDEGVVAASFLGHHPNSYFYDLSIGNIVFAEVATGWNRECTASCRTFPITQKLNQHVRSVDGAYEFDEVLYPVGETPWSFLQPNAKAYSWSRLPNRYINRVVGGITGYGKGRARPFLYQLNGSPEEWELDQIQITMDPRFANWGSAVYGPWYAEFRGPPEFRYGRVLSDNGLPLDSPVNNLLNPAVATDFGPHIWYVNQGYRDPGGTEPPQATRLIGVNRRIQCDPLLWYYRDYLWLGDKYRLCEIEITLGANDYVWTYPSGTTNLGLLLAIGHISASYLPPTLHFPGDLTPTRLQKLAVDPSPENPFQATPHDVVSGAYVAFFSWLPTDPSVRGAPGGLYRGRVPLQQYIQSETDPAGGLNYDPFTFSGGTQGPGGPYTFGYYISSFTTPVFELRNLTNGTTIRRGGHIYSYPNLAQEEPVPANWAPNRDAGTPTWTNGPYGDAYDDNTVNLSNGEWEIEVVEPPKYTRVTLDMTVHPFDAVAAYYPRSWVNRTEEVDVPLGNLKYHPFKFHAVGVDHTYVWKFVAGTGMADVLNATLTAPDRS